MGKRELPGNITLLTMMAVLTCGCGKECVDEAGNVTSSERAWIPYAQGASTRFANGQGDTTFLIAGAIEDRAHYGGGSKGECGKNFHSLHQQLSGADLIPGTELTVVHDRATGNAPGYVCGTYMDMPPVDNIVVNGVVYDQVYISGDSSIWFKKSVGLLRSGEWRKTP